MTDQSKTFETLEEQSSEGKRKQGASAVSGRDANAELEQEACAQRGQGEPANCGHDTHAENAHDAHAEHDQDTHAEHAHDAHAEHDQGELADCDQNAHAEPGQNDFADFDQDAHAEPGQDEYADIEWDQSGCPYEEFDLGDCLPPEFEQYIGRHSRHNVELGRRGEEAAARYLDRAGLEVLERNWTCPAGEADIIARDGCTVVFIEVKTRTGIDKGFPAEAVTPEKRARYEKIAAWYLSKYEYVDVPVRFDVIALIVLSEDRAFMKHYVNAFCVER